MGWTIMIILVSIFPKTLCEIYAKSWQLSQYFLLNVEHFSRWKYSGFYGLLPILTFFLHLSSIPGNLSLPVIFREYYKAYHRVIKCKEYLKNHLQRRAEFIQTCNLFKVSWEPLLNLHLAPFMGGGVETGWVNGGWSSPGLGSGSESVMRAAWRRGPRGSGTLLSLSLHTPKL